MQWQDFQRLRGTNVNDNVPDIDYQHALHYQRLCIKEFGFDPLATFPGPLINLNSRYKINAHWVAKFEYLVHTGKREYANKERRKNIKVVKNVLRSKNVRRKAKGDSA